MCTMSAHLSIIKCQDTKILHSLILGKKKIIANALVFSTKEREMLYMTEWSTIYDTDPLLRLFII